MNIDQHSFMLFKVVDYKNLTLVSGMDRQICPEGHILASRGSPSDAKL